MPRKKTTKTQSPTDQTPVAAPLDQEDQEKILISGRGDSALQKEAVLQASDLFNQDGELVVDVFETDSDFFVVSAIAGVSIKDIDISVDGGMMIIKGQRQNPHGNPQKKYFHQECYWGPFSRKIILAENVNTGTAEAQMDKGLLTIKIPKNTNGALASIERVKKEVNLS